MNEALDNLIRAFVAPLPMPVYIATAQLIEQIYGVKSMEVFCDEINEKESMYYHEDPSELLNLIRKYIKQETI